MNCPTCQRAVLQWHAHTAVEPHGEIHTDEWYECPACHTRYDARELEAL